jgi:hypothetical protein
MIIEELSAPDDYMTLNALKCTVHLKQIIFANVAETVESKRPAATSGPTSGGAQQAQNLNNDTTLNAMAKAAGKK